MNDPVLTFMIPKWTLVAFVSAWGAVWGSFATVIIWRFPRGESIVTPASRCPACQKPIRWHDNIPLFGYLLLGGKCRSCKTRIPLMYPAVELICVMLALIVFFRFYRAEGALLLFLTIFFIHFTFFWILFVVSVVDIRSFLVPDILTLPGIVLFLTYNLIVARERTLVIALSVAGAYLVVFLCFNLLYRIFTGIEGMGMGDAKLLAMVAALTGWQGALFSLIGGAAQGILVNTPLILYRRRKAKQRLRERGEGDGEGENAGEKRRSFLRTEVPFGPMLALSAFEYVLWGDRIVEVYISLADSIALLLTRI